VGDFGETVVIDWGLAKDLSDPTDVSGRGGASPSIDDQLTSAGRILGTPAYMAPEQERGEPVDQRADVFAIGATLWELCSLKKVPPTDTRQRDCLLRRAGIDRDLVAIIDKALDPDRRRRYRDAGALAADLKAFKSGARITGRDYSLPAMLAHWTRRHRALAISALGFAVLVLISVTALAVLYRSSSRNADMAQQRLLKSYVEQGRHALLDNKSEEALVYLAQAYRRGEVTPDVRFMLARAAQPRLMTEAVLTNPAGRLWSAIFSPDDKRIVTTDDHGGRVWDAQTHQLLFELPHTAQVYQADYAREGAWIVTAGMDGDVKVWSSESGVLVRALRHPSPGPVAPAYVRTAVSHSGSVDGAMFITRDRRIMTASTDGAARTWDGITGQLIQSYVGTPVFLTDAASSPDGTLVVTAAGDGLVRFWSASSGAQLWSLPAHADIISSLHFEGADLVTRGFAGDIARWTLPALPPASVLESLLRCLPIRFDDESGTLVEQARCERPFVRPSGEPGLSATGSR